jgi:hypothetical protein
MYRHVRVSLLLSLLIALRLSGAQQVAVAPITTESVEEAIRVASDEKAARKVLDAYVVQTRAGWGNGPLIGTFSTPFARVVQAVLAARKKGNPFTAADVPPDLIVPELHVIATSQQATEESMTANVLSVVLAPRGNKSADDVVQPLRTIELTKEYQTLNGTAFAGPGVVAVFPLSALTTNFEIRVSFDRMARGSTGLSMCRECVVPVSIGRIR